jgi:hypothetical protein
MTYGLAAGAQLFKEQVVPRRTNEKRSPRRPAASTERREWTPGRSATRDVGHHADERRQLLENEEARLDRLESRTRERDAAAAAKIERRLLGVTKFRKAIRQ